jgi:hypothetical protein
MKNENKDHELTDLNLAHNQNTNNPNNPNNDVLCYPEGIYNWVFNICFIHLIHISLAFYNGLYMCGIMGIVLFSTSINYWRLPLMNSYRRFVDICVALTSIVYHYYLSFMTNNIIAQILISIGIVMYPLNYYLHYQNYIKVSALCHCSLHTFISLGANFIYIYYYND